MFKAGHQQLTRIKRMNLQEYFKEEPKGAINEMAGFLGVTPTWMSLLIHGHKKPSPKLAIMIEKATQGLVTKKILRPDIFLE
jgi:DNA-binding transcriptional regulator YdaS (Cro superfamily)